MANPQKRASLLIDQGVDRAASGDLDAAERLLRQAVALHRSAHGLVNLANVLADRGDAAAAAACYADALALDPDSFECHANAGLLACEQGRRADACRLLRRAVELDANYFEGWYNLAVRAHANSRAACVVAAARAHPLCARVLQW
jgi:tetratricopeptide (TPR) repeat protein